MLRKPLFMPTGGKLHFLHWLTAVGRTDCVRVPIGFRKASLQIRLLFPTYDFTGTRCSMPGHHTLHFLDLPSASLALVIQKTASGPGGLASAAALCQTCKSLHSQCEGPAVTYCNLNVPGTISSPAHQVWQWLAKRSGRVAGLILNLKLEGEYAEHEESLLQWTQQLKTLSGIPGVQMTVEWEHGYYDQDYSKAHQWLRANGQSIKHLTVDVYVNEDKLKLRRFVEAAAHCRSIGLSIESHHLEVNLADLAPLAGSLDYVICDCGFDMDPGRLSSLSVLTIHQLTSLCLECVDFTNEQPWSQLAKLTTLNQLSLQVCASGDPSPLSALTRLSSLRIYSPVGILADPFSFSSLQPLSTLQHLETLELHWDTCTATSLHGLAGLCKLTELKISGGLRSLEGIGSGVIDLKVACASDFVSLGGLESCSSMKRLALAFCKVSSWQPLKGLSSIEHLHLQFCGLTSLEALCGLPSTSLQSLTLYSCKAFLSLSGIEQLTALTTLSISKCQSVTSLSPLSQLGEGLQSLTVKNCSLVQEVVLQLPRVQITADVSMVCSNVREVVLAGGVRRAMQSLQPPDLG
jgi:hypothetical protein